MSSNTKKVSLRSSTSAKSTKTTPKRRGKQGDLGRLVQLQLSGAVISLKNFGSYNPDELTNYLDRFAPDKEMSWKDKYNEQDRDTNYLAAQAYMIHKSLTPKMKKSSPESLPVCFLS